MRILEIDGKEFHQQSNLDYARDRLFEKNGIRTTRYTASECMADPDAIVEEFLELFDY
jgi:very-short-patch-repair endonuclease